MTILNASSEAAGEILRALNLPNNTISFTLRMRSGEPCKIEVESYVDFDNVKGLTTVLKRYRLEEIGEDVKRGL